MVREDLKTQEVIIMAKIDTSKIAGYPGTDVLASIIIGTDSQQKDAIFTQRIWQNLLL